MNANESWVSGDEPNRTGLPLLIHPAILHCLCNMLRKNVLAVSQVSNGACHFKHAVVSACRQVEAADGLLQQRDALRVGCA